MDFGPCNPQAISRCCLFNVRNPVPQYAYIAKCSCSGCKRFLPRKSSGNQTELNLITVATVNLPGIASVPCSHRMSIHVTYTGVVSQ